MILTQRAAMELALEQVQEFKRRWWLVPAFGNKVNKATREAVTNAHSPIFALEHALRAALAEQPAEQTFAEYIETACALIKAADDAAADGDYMLDSDDCIKVLRGQWGAPLANDHPPKPQPAKPAQQDAQAASQGDDFSQCKPPMRHIPGVRVDLLRKAATATPTPPTPRQEGKQK